MGKIMHLVFSKDSSRALDLKMISYSENLMIGSPSLIFFGGGGGGGRRPLKVQNVVVTTHVVVITLMYSGTITSI